MWNPDALPISSGFHNNLIDNLTRGLYEEVWRGLPEGKLPGPDEIPNDILRWAPSPQVVQALENPEDGPPLEMRREVWLEIVSSTILWGRSMQKKLLQDAKNAGYVKYRKQWRAKFWTQRKRAHRGVTKEGSSPSLLTLRDPCTGVLEHSEGLKKAVEKGFRDPCGTQSDIYYHYCLLEPWRRSQYF